MRGSDSASAVFAAVCKAVLWGSMALAASRAEAQDMPGWAHSARITMNTTATGANVSGEVKAYPVAVSQRDLYQGRGQQVVPLHLRHR